MIVPILIATSYKNTWKDVAEGRSQSPGTEGSLGSRCHRFGGDLSFQLRGALQRQATKVAADQMVASQRNDGNKEQSEIPLRFHGREHGGSSALGARIFDLIDGLCFRSHAKQKKHIDPP